MPTNFEATENVFGSYDDLHELTMGIYTTRIHAVLSSYQVQAPHDVVEILASLTDLAANERVLDEAPLRDLPDPEHPAVRNLRDQLRHTQTVVDILTALPASRFEQLAPHLDITSRKAVASFIEDLSRVGRITTKYAASTTATRATISAYDEVIDMLFTRLETLTARFDGSNLHTHTELFAAIQEVRSLRASAFRDAAHIEAPDLPCLPPPGDACCADTARCVAPASTVCDV